MSKVQTEIFFNQWFSSLVRILETVVEKPRNALSSFQMGLLHTGSNYNARGSDSSNLLHRFEAPGFFGNGTLRPAPFPHQPPITPCCSIAQSYRLFHSPT